MDLGSTRFNGDRHLLFPQSYAVEHTNVTNTINVPLSLNSLMVASAELSSDSSNTGLLMIGDSTVDARAGVESGWRPLEPGERFVINRPTDLAWWYFAAVTLGETLQVNVMLDDTEVITPEIKPYSSRLEFPTISNFFRIPLAQNQVVQSFSLFAEFSNSANFRIGGIGVQIITGFGTGSKELQPGNNFTFIGETNLNKWYISGTSNDVIRLGAMI